MDDVVLGDTLSGCQVIASTGTLLLTTLFLLSWKQHTITTPLYRTDEYFGSQKLCVEILLCYLLNGATANKSVD